MDLVGVKEECMRWTDPTPAEGGRSFLAHLHSKGLNVVCAVRSPGKIGQIKLDLVPAIIQPHRHRADEGFDPRCRLVVGGPKPPTSVLVVQYLPLK